MHFQLTHHAAKLEGFIEVWGVLNDHDQYDHVSTARASCGGQAGTSIRSILLEPPTAAQESGATPAAQQRLRCVCVHIPLAEGGVASVRVLPGAAAPIAVAPVAVAPGAAGAGAGASASASAGMGSAVDGGGAAVPGAGQVRIERPKPEKRQRVEYSRKAGEGTRRRRARLPEVNAAVEAWVQTRKEQVTC